jgi:hypothetical protein
MLSKQDIFRTLPATQSVPDKKQRAVRSLTTSY